MHLKNMEWYSAGYLSVAGFCEQGNEPTGSMRDGEFLD
jgi:hypothetical protein